MISRVFLDHPRKVDESYIGHAWFALRFAGLLSLAAGANAVFAVQAT